MKEKIQSGTSEKYRDLKNYPVDVKAIKIRWFINSKYGKEFLI